MSCAGRSITEMTVNPPTAGSASTWARSTASWAGARRWRNDSSAYRVVATTRASLDPGGSSGAGSVSREPVINDLFLLLGRHAGQLQHVAAVADLHHPVGARRPPPRRGH